MNKMFFQFSILVFFVSPFTLLCATITCKNILNIVLRSRQLQIGSSIEDSPRGFLDFLFGPCKCRCGIPNREARLLGGEYLRGYEFPWLGLVHLKGVASIPGTLINDRYVITSAAPLLGLAPHDVKVSLGLFDRCVPDISSTNVSVEAIKIHPDFALGNRAHDLSLLKLSNHVSLERRISPICLSSLGTKYLGQVATLVGWSEAKVSEGELVSSCRPRKLGLPVLNQADCLSTTSNPTAVSTDKGCVGVVGVPSVVCKTDAGGPVMYRSYKGVYELIGVLTDKNECSQRPSTALYTNINDNLSWISDSTKDGCFCVKT